jgi:hypothetical protein
MISHIYNPKISTRYSLIPNVAPLKGGYEFFAIKPLTTFKSTENQVLQFIRAFLINIRGIQEFVGHLLSVLVDISRVLNVIVNKLRAFNNHTDSMSMQIETKLSYIYIYIYTHQRHKYS